MNQYRSNFRLWGAQGQKILMESKVCLLFCEPAGVETLKNLILPGIGSVTIVDNQDVTDRDLGNNFFLTDADLGKKRSEVGKIVGSISDVLGCEILALGIKSRCQRRSSRCPSCWPFAWQPWIFEEGQFNYPQRDHPGSRIWVLSSYNDV